MKKSTNWKLYNELMGIHTKSENAHIGLSADGLNTIEITYRSNKDKEALEEQSRLLRLGFIVKSTGRKYIKLSILNG